MPLRELSVAVVGAEHPNKRGPARRYGIALCAPGDPIELRREPKNQFDEYAIAVFGHDIQLGYIRSERAALLARAMDRGREVSAIFQHGTAYGAVVRIALDGELPSLPGMRPEGSSLTHDFYSDATWPDDDFGEHPDADE